MDIPDIRVVVYLGSPCRLRDYTQESGRAGRDRHASEAIIVCPVPVKKRAGGWIDPKAIDIAEFIQPDLCRRIIMDRVMDGRDDREQCEEGEEKCDVCRADEEVRERMISQVWIEDVEDDENDEAFADSGVALTQSSPCPRIEALQDQFQRQQHQRQWQRTQMFNEQREEAIEIDEFRRQLEEWRSTCPLCRVQGQGAQDHVLEDCPHPDVQDVLQ